ncbi:unnamed protein product [Wuchereria bancrofti]|uniref:Uncharacterized protein n=1 Tax=Wuchereria bancrofti TaxID=6293 RepID=A0A3P7EKN2_WUCBA|nr:unnamed protein product [Wuchereria bancrofti]
MTLQQSVKNGLRLLMALRFLVALRFLMAKERNDNPYELGQSVLFCDGKLYFIYQLAIVYFPKH